MITNFIQAGKQASIAKLQTTVGDGVNDIWADMVSIPQGVVRYFQSFAVLPTSINVTGSRLAFMICDATMGQNLPPLLATGRFDSQKGGAVIIEPLVVTAATSFFIPDVLAAPGQFLRMVTWSPALGPPAIGDVFNVTIFYSDILICDPNA